VKQRSEKRNEGVALILTLLFVVLLTVLVVEFAYEAQVEASYSMNSGNDYQARLAARSAVYKGISILESARLQTELSASQGMNGTNNSRNNSNNNTMNSGVQVDSRLSVWAQPGTFEPLNDAVMRTTITDEFGKINLNALVVTDGGERIVREHIRLGLEEFFRLRGEAASAEVDPTALVESIIDWIDEDDEMEQGGAESDFYLASENPYNAKNGPMDSIDELLLIKGMTTDLFFGAKGLDNPQLPLSEYLTVHGDWLGRINPNTVYIEYETGLCDVLAAMSVGWVDAGMAAEVRHEQLVEDMLNAEDDTHAFQSVDDLAGYVEHVDLGDAGTERPRRNRDRDENDDGNGNQSRAQAEVLRHMFTVYSHVFRIHGDALLDELMVRNEVYVLRVPQDQAMLDWPSGNDNLPFVNPMPQTDGAIPEEFYRILEWKVIQ
jgi:type II secretory pathway component PulK